METKYKPYYKRGFLNKDKGAAIFEADVSVAHYNGHSPWIDAGFNLTDCHRQISLDFCADTEEEYRDKMSKLNTLIGQLHCFEAEMGEAYKEFKRIKDESKNG